MHMAIFSIPANIAVRFGIPLVVWGENSAFEYGGRERVGHGFSLDAAWLARHGVTHGTTAEDWLAMNMTRRTSLAYIGPDSGGIGREDVQAVFLGYYFEWDPERTRASPLLMGSLADPRGARTGLYDYADIDDDFISIHHWIKWYKFGFTRLFDNLSLEIRNGRLSRDEAIDDRAQTGDETPLSDIEKLCGFLQVTEDQFFQVCEKFRNPAIWRSDRECGKSATS